MSHPINEDVRMLAKLFSIVYEAIRDSGPDGIPSGHLYVQIQSTLPGWGLTVHNQAIATMVQAGYITNTNHLLRATGKV